MPPTAPTTSRAALSAPPVQQSFSTVVASAHPVLSLILFPPVLHTVLQVLFRLRSSRPVVIWALLLLILAWPRSPPSNDPVPSAPMVPRSTSTSAYPGAQGDVPTRPAALTSASAYATTSAHVARPTFTATNGVQKPASTQQNAGGAVPSTTTAVQSAPAQPATSAQPALASRPSGTIPASAYAASSPVPATRATVAPVGPPQTANSSVPLSSALGQYGAASTTNGTGPQPASVQTRIDINLVVMEPYSRVLFTGASLYSAGVVWYKDSKR